MTRVLILDMEEGDVIAKCLAAKVTISAIERIPAGGVRLVCASVDGAARMRKSLKSHLVSGEVTRTRHRPVTPLW